MRLVFPISLKAVNTRNAPILSLAGNHFALRPVVAAALAAAVAAGGLWVMPETEMKVFAAGAAWLGGLLSGSPVLAAEGGWALPAAGIPVVVTEACSATDFYLILGVLASWQLSRRGHPVWRAVVVGLGAAIPVTLCVNAVRILSVAQAHRWLIPRAPDDYGSFLHMLTGVAVFLPALIALNLVFEFHGRSEPRANP